jgi:protein kinase A
MNALLTSWQLTRQPENVLLDQDGYCVIVDLGFAKFVQDKTYTFCGTPLFIAPEVILSKGKSLLH